VLLYLLQESVKAKVETKTEEKATLETELEEPISQPADELDFISLRYLPSDNPLLPELIYTGKPFDMYGTTSLFTEDEEYKPAQPANDDYQDYDPGSYTIEEAREKLEDLKYEFLEPSSEKNYEERKRLALWITFHAAKFSFFELFYGLNREVDYRSAV